MSKLAKKLAELCRAKKVKIAVAESCTGGMISSFITSVVGSSEIFDRGFITYSYESKTDLLGVQPTTLKLYGAVSAKVAVEMAKGALKNSNADISLSITGIAGPTGATDHKPVGLVYFATHTATNVEPECVFHQFEGNRALVRKAASNYGLQLLINQIERL